ncbi:hypothetical protein LYNGBM3L_37250 [Moorena producens 3L]|uniref:Uncharacterized protein n=1 Tax=Moorena producens 3L TaxID=489825 RepID=F4XPX5_9CYAN|nr:hypothetical protein LYNGBM3L_37250 [Moorena producens 3L]OLT68800.1 hypothetical protein BI334_30720 [Moorena producens 3L]
MAIITLKPPNQPVTSNVKPDNFCVRATHFSQDLLGEGKSVNFLFFPGLFYLSAFGSLIVEGLGN